MILPRELGDAAWRTVDAPQLKTLLARALYHPLRDTAYDSTAILCKLFGIERQHDYPLAPLMALRAGLDTGRGYWLCATPCHLETRRNALVLAEPAALKITFAESAALAATLTNHLREEKVTLHAPQADRWFIQCDLPPAMTTHSLDAVTGRDVRPFLPQGADSRRWHRVLTEMQMLLHAHPINEAREAEGRLPINTVWFWAGGTLPPKSTTRIAAVWSTDDVVCALAQHAGCPVEAPPQRITPGIWAEGEHFLSTNVLTEPMRQGDLQAWSAAVTAVNRDWFHPLLETLKSRRATRLTLISGDHTGTHEFILRPQDLLKFWRNNKYLQ